MTIDDPDSPLAARARDGDRAAFEELVRRTSRLVFARLFLDNPADRVLRFLDEDSTSGDEARLIASMPKAPYVRAVAARAHAATLRRVEGPVGWVRKVR